MGYNRRRPLVEPDQIRSNRHDGRLANLLLALDHLNEADRHVSHTSSGIGRTHEALARAHMETATSLMRWFIRDETDKKYDARLDEDSYDSTAAWTSRDLA